MPRRDHPAPPCRAPTAAIREPLLRLDGRQREHLRERPIATIRRDPQRFVSGPRRPTITICSPRGDRGGQRRRHDRHRATLREPARQRSGSVLGASRYITSPVRCASVRRFIAETARRRLRAIVVLFHAHQHRWIGAGGAEPAAVSASQNSSSCRACSSRAHAQPLRIAGGLEQFEHAEDQIRVVLRVRLDRGIAASDSAAASVLVRRSTSRHDERRRRGRAARCALGLSSVRALRAQRHRRQHARRARERRDHQPVPRRQHLVVQHAARPQLADVEQDLARSQAAIPPLRSAFCVELPWRCRRSTAPCRADSC